MKLTAIRVKCHKGSVEITDNFDVDLLVMAILNCWNAECLKISAGRVLNLRKPVPYKMIIIQYFETVKAQVIWYNPLFPFCANFARRNG